MKHYIFSRRGLAQLAPFLEDGTLFAFDFDGTLAPITPLPHKAALPTAVDRLLKKLSARQPVVLISGRSLSDLKGRVPSGLRALVGNHGAEGIPGQKILLTSSARQVKAWEKALSPLLANLSGVALENKRYSLSLHYRASRNRANTQRTLLTLSGTLTPPPRLVAGKCVINLVPEGQPHKGAALLRLMKKGKFKRAIFVGDDDTDEDVFGLHDPRILTVRIGLKRASSAQAYLRNQAEMAEFLHLLLEQPRQSLRRR